MHDEVPFYLYADARGEILMASNGIKEVIEPFPFGTAILLRLAWYPELLEAAKTVVNALGYRGILMIEFVEISVMGIGKLLKSIPVTGFLMDFMHSRALATQPHWRRTSAVKCPVV